MKTTLFCIFLLLSGIISAQTIDNPPFKARSGSISNITRIERTPENTRVYIHAIFRPHWWIMEDGDTYLVVSENLPLFGYSTAYKPITYKILFRETNPRRDKNGTEPQENKIKNALLRISASEYLLLRCKGTNLSRQKRIKTHKVHIYSAFFIFLYHDG